MAANDPSSLVRNARAVIRKGAQDHPHRRGMEQAAQGSYEAAIASFREAIAATPDAPWSYVALAQVLVETGAPAEAADAFRRALERTPAAAVALQESIAAGLGGLGDLDTAIAAYRAVLVEEPGRVTATVGLARALLGRAEQMQGEAARLLVDADDPGLDQRLIEAAIDAAPRVPGLYRRLAGSLAARGDRTRAITVIQVGLAHDPEDPDALALLAEIVAADDGGADALLDGEREHLLELVEQAAAAHPDDVALLVRRAQLVAGQGPPARAVDAWRAVVACEPEVAEWHRELGDHLAGAGDFEGAGAAYDRAVALGYHVY